MKASRFRGAADGSTLLALPITSEGVGAVSVVQ